MRILVKYNNSSYYWVDTVITSDDCTLAILVSNEGVVFPIRLEKIEVVDENYLYEKQKEKRIEELKIESAHLALRRELDAQINRALRDTPISMPTLKYTL